MLTSGTPYEAFTAGLLELSITWFSEIVKWTYTLRGIRIEGEDFLIKSPELIGKTLKNKLCYLFSKINDFFSFLTKVPTKSKHEGIKNKV